MTHAGECRCGCIGPHKAGCCCAKPYDLGPLPKCLSCWSGTDVHEPDCKTLRPATAPVGDLTDEELG